MKKTATAQSTTVELATEAALQELGTTIDRVDVEVISKGGLFDKAEVKVTLKDDAVAKVSEFVNGVLSRMNLRSTANVKEEQNTLHIEIVGEDSGAAIGYRGEVLDAFQYLVLTYLNQENIDFKKVVVDSEGYRDKRVETLTALAGRLAEKSVRLAREIALEAMNPFERRIIHSALAESEIVRTASEGDEPNRFVVIIPKDIELSGERIAARENDRHDNKGGHDRRRDGGRRDGDRRNGRRDGRRDDRFGDRRRDDRPQKERKYIDDDEVADGAVHRASYADAQPKSEPAAKAPGAPKFKSFGGKRF